MLDVADRLGPPAKAVLGVHEVFSILQQGQGLGKGHPLVGIKPFLFCEIAGIVDMPLTDIIGCQGDQQPVFSVGLIKMIVQVFQVLDAGVYVLYRIEQIANSQVFGC